MTFKTLANLYRSPIILHVDIDAFFPSVEQVLNPKLKGKPVIVGAGVIASCSYEARRLGLHTGSWTLLPLAALLLRRIEHPLGRDRQLGYADAGHHDHGRETRRAAVRP